MSQFDFEDGYDNFDTNQTTFKKIGSGSNQSTNKNNPSNKVTSDPFKNNKNNKENISKNKISNNSSYEKSIGGSNSKQTMYNYSVSNYKDEEDSEGKHQVIISPFSKQKDELSEMIDMNSNSKTFDPNKEYNPEEELPLLEELGIRPDIIKEKIYSILTMNKLDRRILEDSEMTGPLLIFTLFCVSLILQKKSHFGYIYGITLIGGFFISTLMNLMSKNTSILFYNTISVLGYCLLPVVLASFIGLLVSLKGLVGVLVCLFSIIYSSYSATNFFEESLSLQNRKILLLYPLILYYTSYLLITLY